MLNFGDHLGFVCELSFGGEGRGRKGLWRGKPLFASFKKNWERFWGVLKGFICPILKFPKIGGLWGGLKIQIDNFSIIIIQNSNFRHDQIIIIFFFTKTTYSKQLIFTKQLIMTFFKKQLIQNNLFMQNSLL